MSASTGGDKGSAAGGGACSSGAGDAFGTKTGASTTACFFSGSSFSFCASAGKVGATEGLGELSVGDS
ncbi:hypothetical protein H0H87_006304, partial [Tephrocybe sp. NHM501043]